MAVPVALSIAGSDPTGGAGLQLDLQVFRALGAHGAGVVTALTVQDSRKVHQVLPAFPSVVLEQLRVLLRDLRPDAVKLGMLASDDVARSVSLALDSLRADGASPPPVVLDPVLAASDGTPLLERRAYATLIDLHRGAALVTPNLIEAEMLTGFETRSREGCEEAAAKLVREFGAHAALVKGGHRDGAPDDLLATRAGEDVALTWLAGSRSEGPELRGTGCALASAVAAGLAHGRELAAAVADARAFVGEAIARAHARGPEARFLEFG